MKKLIVNFLVLLSTGVAFALPVGNPAEPSLMKDGVVWEGLCADFSDPCVSWYDALSFRAGFYGDYVFDRHLEVKNNILGTKGNDIEKSSLFTNACYLAANVYDRIDLFTNLGMSHFILESNAVTFGGPAGARYEIDTNADFSWGVGARAILFECRRIDFGVEGQYFNFHPEIHTLTTADESVYPLHRRLKYQEYQFGIGVSYKICDFVPYIGARWGGVEVKGDLPKLANRFQGGYVVGVSYVNCERVSITCEGRWLDEKAFYVNGQLRF